VNAFDDWLAALEARHLAELTFPEMSRALKALSSTYVERRQKISEGAALAGRGKRAAFALFYGPLHHLLVAHAHTLVLPLDRFGSEHEFVSDRICVRKDEMNPRACAHGQGGGNKPKMTKDDAYRLGSVRRARRAATRSGAKQQDGKS